MSKTLAPAAPAESRIVFHDVSWSFYQEIAATRRDRSVPRLTYFHGILELTSPSYYHKYLACRLREFVIAIARSRRDLLRGRLNPWESPGSRPARSLTPVSTS